MKLLFAIVFSFSFFSMFASDITIYVSPNGSGKGTIEKPTTLEKAIAMLPDLKKNNPKGTISIVLKDGEYELNKPITITNENGGTKDLKIIFKAAANAHPVISGGRKIVLKGEGVLSENIFSIVKEYKSEPYDIYVNGKRAVRARTPNSGFFQLGKTQEIKDTVKLGKKNSTQSYGIPLDLHQELATLSDSQLQKVRFNIYHKWDNTMRSIDSLDKSKPAFYSTGVAWKPWNAIYEKYNFYVENYAKALDTLNEWFLDGTTLQYIPEQLKTKQQEIIIPVLEQLLIIKGDGLVNVSNMSFKGISFYYTNRPFAEFAPTQAAATIDAAIMVDHARDIAFEDCKIGHTAQYGIWFRKNVKDSSINHCYINDLGAGGLRIGETKLSEAVDEYSSNNKIENNIIHSGGYNFPCAIGVFIAHSGNNIVSHNDIGDFRYSGVSVGWVWGYTYSPAVNNKIVYNHIHHIGWGVLSDMSGVYTLGISDGTEVSNNVIHDVYSYDYGGWGLYTDEGSSNIRMENNLVYKTKTGGFHQHYGKDNIIRNNILAFNDKFQAQFTRVEEHQSFDFVNNILISDKGVMLKGPWQQGKITLDNNCYWNMNNEKCVFTDSAVTFDQWQKKSGKDAHSIFQDPGFVNAAAYNFKLKDESIVKKIGFKPFDIDKVGVFGDKKWKKQAELPKEIIKAFDESVAKNRLN